MLFLLAPVATTLLALTGQSNPTVPSPPSETPLRVEACELKANPGTYNHKLVAVTGFVSQGFEDFALQDPQCPEAPGPWLEYGGTVNSGVVYCCGPTNNKTRPHQLTIEEIPIPIVEDDQLKLLQKRLQRPTRESNLVHATLIGRFFAGHWIHEADGKTYWEGFGHMGCCSLLAIQQVTQVDDADNPNLDHDPWATFPYTEGDKVGCGYTNLLPLNPMQEMQAAQKPAETTQQWAFDQPDRVASDALAQRAKLADIPTLSLDRKHTTPARRVYTWHPAQTHSTYTVILSRPYWLSFYAADPNHVAWVVRAAFLSSCDKNNSVTRIR